MPLEMQFLDLKFKLSTVIVRWLVFFCCEFQIPFTPVIPVILNWHELNWHALMNLNMTGSCPDPDP